MHPVTRTGEIVRALAKIGIAFGDAIAIAIATFLLVALPWYAHAQPPKYEVRATVDRKAIDPTDTIVLSVGIESEEEIDVQAPTLPPLSDFEVLNQWQGKEVRANLINTPTGPQFKSVRRVVFNWQLSPKKLGALTIFPVEVVVAGHSTRTSAISVQVASGAGQKGRGNVARRNGRGSAKPPPGFEDDSNPAAPGEDEEEDLFSQLLRRGMQQVPQGGSRTLPKNANEAFFIQVETDKTEAYVGEQVTVSFYLYTAGIIRDLDTLKYPSLKGFWKEDIEIATHLNFQSEVVDGVPYKKALLASFALFPIKEGPSTIDPYQAKCTVISGNDPFGSLGMGRAFTFTKSSEPIKIKVKPLPLEGRPTDYSGAVGDFQVTARIEDNNVVANQPFPLKIRFEGRGNAKLIDIPPFQPPEGMELYDTQKDSKFFGWGTSFKEFTLLLIPRREGEFVIPPIAASMFDPQTKKYISRATETLKVRVGVGTKSSGQDSASFTGQGKTGGKILPAGPIEPRLIEVFRPESTLTLSQTVGGAAGLFAMAFAFLLAVASRELGWGRGKPRLGRRVKNRVRDLEAKAKKGDVRQVGVAGVNLLAFALREIVGDRVSEREVLKLLSATPPSIQKECAPVIEDVLHKFELLAFAPDSIIEEWKNPTKLRELIDQTAKTLDRVVSLSGSDERSV
jgi:hypothetical protein